jgi:hypothetical protein
MGLHGILGAAEDSTRDTQRRLDDLAVREAAHRPPTLKQRLVSTKTALHAQLDMVDRALEVLDENPKAEEIVDALRNAGFYH